jgi:hypothetical protein
MADITKCDGDGCPRKETCYRFTAEASELRQSYFMNAPIKEDNTCEYYWPNENDRTKKVPTKNSKRRAWHH